MARERRNCGPMVEIPCTTPLTAKFLLVVHSRMPLESSCNQEVGGNASARVPRFIPNKMSEYHWGAASSINGKEYLWTSR